MYHEFINARFIDTNDTEERDFMGRDIYEPIRRKVEEWLWYDENQPKGNWLAYICPETGGCR